MTEKVDDTLANSNPATPKFNNPIKKQGIALLFLRITPDHPCVPDEVIIFSEHQATTD